MPRLWTDITNGPISRNAWRCVEAWQVQTVSAVLLLRLCALYTRVSVQLSRLPDIACGNTAYIDRAGHMGQPLHS